VGVPSQGNGSRGWRRIPDEFCRWVRTSVAVWSRNAVEWRLARDTSKPVNQYAKRHFNAKYAENATRLYTFTNTQEGATHSAAPSKCTHSSNQGIIMDRTGTDQQNITSNHHTILLHAFICRHAQASPEAGATRPSQHAKRWSIS
jgi:hypothetical protein